MLNFHSERFNSGFNKRSGIQTLGEERKGKKMREKPIAKVQGRHGPALPTISLINTYALWEQKKADCQYGGLWR